MGMAGILFNGPEPIVNILSPEGPMWNLVKTVQAVSEKKMFKDFMIMYIAQGQGQTTTKIFMVAKQFYFCNHTL